MTILEITEKNTDCYLFLFWIPVTSSYKLKQKGFIYLENWKHEKMRPFGYTREICS